MGVVDVVDGAVRWYARSALGVEPHGDATETTQTEAAQPDAAIDWKAQARKWEKLAKANREKAEQADQLREKAEKADQLQARLDELTAAQAWEKTVGKVSGRDRHPRRRAQHRQRGQRGQTRRSREDTPGVRTGRTASHGHGWPVPRA